MLVGLLFATHDTEDRPDRLTAMLPFGGVTLLEYQARLLIAAGCAQIVVVAARRSPELLGAVSRIGRRGVAVDAVAHAGEAVETLHPLARMLMLADGLITSVRIVMALAGEGGDALLVVPQAQAGPHMELVGGQMAWAGAARLDARHMAEAARLPRDYDLQSTLLRFAEQARAAHMPLSIDAAWRGHGIERDGTALARRSRAAVAAIVSDRNGWVDRWLIAPLARVALPEMVERRWSGAAVAAGGMVIAAIALVAITLGASVAGLVLTLTGFLVLTLAGMLGNFRDEPGVERAVRGGSLAFPALATLCLGGAVGSRTGDHAALALASALVTLAALAEYAGPERARRPWWGCPPAYLVVLLLGAAVGLPVAALALAAAYAALTLAAAIERLRSAALAAL